MKRAKHPRKTSITVPLRQAARAEAIAKLLPINAEQVTSSTLVRRLRETQGLRRRTAIRWLKDAERYIPPGHHYPLIMAVRAGRNRYYGFNPTGLMGPAQVEFSVRAAYMDFLKECPKFADKYKESLGSMTVFWKQASSALVLSLERVIGAAQSVSFAQVHDRVSPSVEVARAQADVLTEVFAKPWIQNLVMALHQFLATEKAKNRMIPRLPDGRLGAPSAMEAFRDGWAWATAAPGGPAHETWIAHMKGPESGPWGEFLDRVRREQEEKTRRGFDRYEVNSAESATLPESKKIT